jgi:hypothetical protein
MRSDCDERFFLLNGGDPFLDGSFIGVLQLIERLLSREDERTKTLP